MATETPTPEDLAPFLGKTFASLRCPAGGTYTIYKVGDSPACTVPNHRLPDR